MKTTVNFTQFVDAFNRMGRENQFSYNGKRALFDYLEELEDGTSEEMELDVIALCCDFTEYENLKEFQSEYGDEYEKLEDIEEQTQVIRIDDESFIIQAF